MTIKGYTPLSDDQKFAMNSAKELEEVVLRFLDVLEATQGVDPRALAVGRTNLQQAFMWINRSIAKPTRIQLPDDMEAEFGADVKEELKKLGIDLDNISKPPQG